MKQARILGLRTTIYKVTDLGKAKEWYSKAFGTEPYFDEPFYVGFNVAGFELGLHPSEQEAALTDQVVAYWGVEDAAASFKAFLDLGARAHEEPRDVGEGIVVATVIDPWNNVIGLIRNPHFKL